MNVLKVPETPAAVKAASDANKGRGVQFVAERILNPPAAAGRGGGRGGAPLTADEQSALERGSTIYTELCFSCHGEDGRGTPTPGGAPGSTLAPSLVGSPRVNAHRDYVIKTLLHGLAGPMDGRTYPQVMVAMGTNSDRWIADIASYVRNGFGNSGIVVTTDDVARVRAATGERQNAVDRCRARCVAAATRRSRCGLDGDGKPRRTPGAAGERGRGVQLHRQRCGRAELSRLDDGCCAAGRHVVPDRAARGADVDGDHVHLVYCWRRPRRHPGLDVPSQVSGAGVERWQHVERADRRRRRRAGHDGDQVRACQREVHPHHADGNRERRAGLVDAAHALVRGTKVAVTPIRECVSDELNVTEASNFWRRSIPDPSRTTTR